MRSPVRGLSSELSGLERIATRTWIRCTNCNCK